jgi:hypothetical protein
LSGLFDPPGLRLDPWVNAGGLDGLTVHTVGYVPEFKTWKIYAAIFHVLAY